MRLVLDTNVVVSGLLWEGAPARLIDVARAGQVELFSSRPLLAGLTRILRRAKFANAISAGGLSIDELVLGYGDLVAIVTPPAIAPTILSDPDDDRVLACALGGNAELIVSGDHDLLSLKAFRGIKIVTPADAVQVVTAG